MVKILIFLMFGASTILRSEPSLEKVTGNLAEEAQDYPRIDEWIKKVRSDKSFRRIISPFKIIVTKYSRSSKRRFYDQLLKYNGRSLATFRGKVDWDYPLLLNGDLPEDYLKKFSFATRAGAVFLIDCKKRCRMFGPTDSNYTFLRPKTAAGWFAGIRKSFGFDGMVVGKQAGFYLVLAFEEFTPRHSQAMGLADSSKRLLMPSVTKKGNILLARLAARGPYAIFDIIAGKKDPLPLGTKLFIPRDKVAR